MLRLASAATFLCATTLVAATPQFHTNLMKYRDTSLPSATGRSGSAAITARALFGKDSVTDLDVTADGPGQLDKVQLKADGSNAVNYNNLTSAAFHARLDGLEPHSSLQVQANVSGADADREDVITADEIVKYRPDLAVAGLRAPDRVMPGLPFEVSATVRELNGDVGARADCVLSSDGVEIDRAQGIWVDAKGSVVCKFAPMLGEMGEHTLTVAATNVDPGDWDDANNSASATITVALPFDRYVAGALESSSHTDIVNENPYTNFKSSIDQWTQWADVYATSTLPIDSTKISATYSESSGGDAIDSVNFSDMDFHTVMSGSNFRCLLGYDDWRGDFATMTVCVSTSPSGTFTQYHADRESLDVAYVSTRWGTTYVGDTGNEWMTTTTGEYTEGLQGQHFGPTVSMVATLTDGTVTLQAAPTVPLAPFDQRYGTPYGCSGKWCQENLTHESGVRGVIVVNHSY